MIYRLEENNMYKKRAVEELDAMFIEGITVRKDYGIILEKMQKYAEFIIAYEGENICGYASMYANDRETKTAYISMIGIKKEYQRKAVGTSLMDKCCERAAEKGMERIRLEVLKNNLTGYRFYKAYGFLEAGEETEKSIFLCYQIT